MLQGKALRQKLLRRFYDSHRPGNNSKLTDGRQTGRRNSDDAVIGRAGRSLHEVQVG